MAGTVLSLSASACAGDPGARASSVGIDTVGTTIIVTNPERAAPSPSPLLARQAFLIGEEEGEPAYTFGSISSLAADEAGRVYVSDVMADEVRVFGPGGEFIERIGRRGDGPGEFRAPTGLAISNSGVLHVRDETRVQRFSPPRPGAAASRYEGSHPGPAYAFSLMTTRLDSAGRLYYPMRAGRIPNQKYFYLVYDSAGVLLDTLSLPASVRVPGETAIFRTGASGGRMVPGLARSPFAPVPGWDVTAEGHLLISRGESYEIAELAGNGDTLRVIRREGAAAPVPPGEYDDSLRAVRQRVADAPAPVERLEGVAEEIRRGELPRTLPQILSVQAGTDGRIWVRRWPAAGEGGALYDALSREGIYQYSVRLPLSMASVPAPVFTDNRVYGVVVDSDTEVQRVVAYDLPAP
ncbi:6-bladed beta-propeller [Longimicrobium sp.]|uniref:6-bladed beta-propeller n=1 Tax=Longimicrobium sp. TaxID=2029185 RepID=UPI002E3687AB|nr:6-bladed beta-propeller [Longimicrobium sp.]